MTAINVQREVGGNLSEILDNISFTIRERIRINGVPITDEEIIDLAAPMISSAEKTKTTFFEITTAMAFQYFAQKKVDIAIIETGMGGRLDATNVVHPLVSVITSIDYDHTDFLGTSLTSISEEKAGIIKYKVPAVIGEPRQNLRPVFEKSLQNKGFRLGICCHPYDLCTELIAREAGVILTDEIGGQLSAKLSVEPDVAWIGYANETVRKQIEPLLQQSLRSRNLI